MTQGSGDLITSLCTNFWNGHEPAPLMDSERSKMLDFYNLNVSTSYCLAFAYMPLLQSTPLMKDTRQNKSVSKTPFPVLKLPVVGCSYFKSYNSFRTLNWEADLLLGSLQYLRHCITVHWNPFSNEKSLEIQLLLIFHQKSAQILVLLNCLELLSAVVPCLASPTSPVGEKKCLLWI